MNQIYLVIMYEQDRIPMMTNLKINVREMIQQFRNQAKLPLNLPLYCKIGEFGVDEDLILNQFADLRNIFIETTDLLLILKNTDSDQEQRGMIKFEEPIETLAEKFKISDQEFTYKNKIIDIKQSCRSLGINFLDIIYHKPKNNELYNNQQKKQKEELNCSENNIYLPPDTASCKIQDFEFSIILLICDEQYPFKIQTNNLTIDDLKQIIYNQLEKDIQYKLKVYKASRFELYYKEKIILDIAVLQNIKEQDVKIVKIVKKKIQIIFSLNGRKEWTSRILWRKSWLQLKSSIISKKPNNQELKEEQIKFIYNGQDIKDENMLLYECNVVEGSTINILIE